MFDGLRRLLSRVGKPLTIAVGVTLWELGARVGLPGVDGVLLSNYLRGASSWLLRLFDTVVGGALTRGGLLALGITPYLSARVFMKLARVVSPELEAMWAQHRGRARLEEWTRRLTVVLSLVQGAGFARFVQNIGAAPSGMAFILQTMIALTAGSVLVMLVSEQLSSVSNPDELREDELSVGDVAPDALTAGPALEVNRVQREREPVRTPIP